MKQKFIPADVAFKEWRKDPDFVAEYDALADEFALASALIEARETRVWAGRDPDHPDRIKGYPIPEEVIAGLKG